MGSIFSACRRAISSNDDLDNGAKEITNPQRGETARRKSIYYDAKEFATASMMPYPPATEPDYNPSSTFSMGRPSALLQHRPCSLTAALEEPHVRVALRGYPGDLTREELKACIEFRTTLREHPDSVYQEMVKAFDPFEEEPYALCRFLRARNFDVAQTMAMCSENIDKWKEAKAHDFFPHVEDILGCPEAVFLTQFPFAFYGYARNSCLVDYLPAGRMSLQANECVLRDFESVQSFFWKYIMYDYPKVVAKVQDSLPNHVRVETVTVVDLRGLDPSQLNKKVLNTLASVASIMGCFPESLNKLIVVNAPWAFSLFWKVIKKILHPRTTAKIEIYSNEREGNNRLLGLIDKDQLLSDFGGDGPSFDSLFHMDTESCRHATELMKSGETRLVVEMTANEKGNVSAYSRAADGVITLLKDGNELIAKDVENPSGGRPFRTNVSSDVHGPGKFSVAISGASRSDHWVVYVEIFPLEPT